MWVVRVLRVATRRVETIYGGRVPPPPALCEGLGLTVRRLEMVYGGKPPPPGKCDCYVGTQRLGVEDSAGALLRRALRRM